MGGNYTVLVVGSGAREHALAWALEGDPAVSGVLVSPGNPAMVSASHTGKISLVPPAPEDDFALAAYLKDLGVHLVVVGPEAPLVHGMADAVQRAGVPVLGPCGRAAQLEGSKIHTRRLCQGLGIPQPRWSSFDNFQSAMAAVNQLPRDCRVVAKADGLAGGKGALLCSTREEVAAAVHELMVEQVFGEAGNHILIEEWLGGREASLIVLTDGEVALPLPIASDYKRLLDSDGGPNTGGMGAIAPSPVLDDEMVDWALEHMVYPILRQLREEGAPYKGFMYLGLMVPPSDGVPRLLEVNVRLGDPEAQVILPLLIQGRLSGMGRGLLPSAEVGAHSSIFRLFMAAATGRLGRFAGLGDGDGAGWKDAGEVGAAVGVVLASSWYPGTAPPDGDWSSEGLQKLLADNRGELSCNNKPGQVLLFWGGVKWSGVGKLVPWGGRLVTVVGIGKTMSEAAGAAYGFIGNVKLDNITYRKDIGDVAHWHMLAKVG